MAREIERKFLVRDQSFKEGIKPVLIRQGFISTEKNKVIRVRIAGDQAFLTLKTNGSGISRDEYEYAIPPKDAEELILRMCGTALIEKYRYRLTCHGHEWEVDEFLGSNSGLIVAEIELQSEEEEFAKPPWLGEEVSHDVRYFNASLVNNPYSKW